MDAGILCWCHVIFSASAGTLLYTLPSWKLAELAEMDACWSAPVGSTLYLHRRSAILLSFQWISYSSSGVQNWGIHCWCTTLSQPLNNLCLMQSISQLVLNLSKENGCHLLSSIKFQQWKKQIHCLGIYSYLAEI